MSVVLENEDVDKCDDKLQSDADHPAVQFRDTTNNVTTV